MLETSSPSRRELLFYYRDGKTTGPLVVLVTLLALAVFPTSTRADTNDVVASPSALKKLSLEELMDVEVTSVSKQPQSLLQAPAAIQVVTGDDIRRSGAASIPEALRLADNLEVAQKTSHDWGISARGFNTDLANKLLVLMDGRSIYTPLFSGVFWDVQDYLMQDIDRIEVISGPGGTLWGANAVNGVINIISKSAEETQGLYVEGGGGTFQRDFAGVRYGGALSSNVFFRVYGKYFDRGNEVFSNGDEATDSWRMGQGGFRLDADASPENHVTLQGDGYGGTEDIPGAGEATVNGNNVLSRWTHTFSDDSDFSLQLYYDRTHIALPKPAGFVPAGILTDDLDTYDLDFQHRFRLSERQRFVWGVGYRFTHDVVQNAPSVVFLPTTLDHNLFSFFVQDEVRIVRDVFFTFGTKVEHNDYTGFETEPSARLRWNITTNHLLWAAVSRAVRTPSRIDHDLQEPTGLTPPLPTSILNGGPDFSSETVIAYELGYRALIGPRIASSISAFYNDYDHIRSTTPQPGGSPSLLLFENNLEGETYGVEFSTTYQVLGWWRLRGGYDYLEEHLRVKPGQVDFSNAHNETADPEQQFSIHSSMDLGRQVQVDAGFRWVDTLVNNNGANTGTVPAYCELDVRLGWQISRNVELSLVGQNLLHERHPEYGFPGAGREEIQRSFYGKLTWQF